MSDVKTPDTGKQIGAGTLAGLNELGFGVPKPVINAMFGPGAWERTVASGDQPTPVMGLKPSDIGGGAGLLGSLFVPGGAVTRMVGAVPKAIGAAKTAAKIEDAANFLGGTGPRDLGSNVLRGAGQALEQAVPRSVAEASNELINNEATPGQAGANALKNIGVGAALGGGLGGGLGLAGGAVRRLLGKAEGGGGWVPEDVAKELQKGSANTAVAGLLGTTTRALRTVANEGANWEKGAIGKANATEQSIQDQANFMARHGIYNLADLDKYHDEIKGTFDQIAAKLTPENTPVPMTGETGFQDWVKKQPWWSDFSRQNPGADDMLDGYALKLQDPSSPSSIFKEGVNPASELYNVTARDASSFRMGQSPEQQSFAKMANFIHHDLMDHAANIAKEDGSGIIYPRGINSPEELQRAYADNKVFRATKRIEATTAQPTSIPGSDTAIKSALMNAAGSMGPGAVIGGYFGSNGDIGNIPGIAAGAVIGGLANRGLSALASRLGGQTSLGINQRLQDSDLGQRIEAMRDAARNMALGNGPVERGVGIGTGGAAPPQIPMGAMGQAGPPPQTPGSPAQMPPQGPGQGQAAAPPQGPNGAGAPMPQPDPVSTLNGMGQYGKVVAGKIMQMYSQIDRNGGQLQAHGITPQSFAAGIMQASNNFDPAIMANVLFPDESQRASFLKSFQSVKQLSAINFDSVLGTNPLLGMGASVLNGQYAAARTQIATVLAQSAKPSDMNAALAQLDQIQWLNVPMDKKKQLMANIMTKSMGIDVSQIHQLGLDQGNILQYAS